MAIEQKLAEAFLEVHPQEAAQLLDRMRPAQVAELLSETRLPTAAALVQGMAVHPAAEALRLLPAERAGSILSRLGVDAAAVRLRPLSAEEREPILAHIAPKSAGALMMVLRYPEDCAGALMDPLVLALPEEITASEARAQVRRFARHVLYYLYIVDREQKLVGVVNLRELMLAPSRQPLKEFMRTDVARVAATADRSAVLVHPAWRQVHTLPVVNQGDALIGAIHYRTLRSLESSLQAEAPRDGFTVAFGLGEMYWLSMGKLLSGMLGSIVGPPPAGKEARHDS